MSNENSVVRIVNLEDDFTEETLKRFIVMNCQPTGDVKKIYLKRDDTLNICYSYVIFEFAYDALKAVGILNEHTFNTNKLEVELIGPDLQYREYRLTARHIIAERKRRVTEYLERQRRLAQGQVPVDEVNKERDMPAPNIPPAFNRILPINRGIVRSDPGQAQINRANNEKTITARNIHPPVNRQNAVRAKPPQLIYTVNRGAVPKVPDQVQINTTNNKRVGEVRRLFHSVDRGNNQNVLAAGSSRSASGSRYIPPHLQRDAINRHGYYTSENDLLGLFD